MNDFVCEIDGVSSDDDNDSITYTIEWDVDGPAYTDATTTNHTGDTVPTEDYPDGETWTCTVTPNDGDEDGDSASASIEIEENCNTGTIVLTSSGVDFERIATPL